MFRVTVFTEFGGFDFYRVVHLDLSSSYDQVKIWCEDYHYDDYTVVNDPTSLEIVCDDSFGPIEGGDSNG